MRVDIIVGGEKVKSNENIKKVLLHDVAFRYHMETKKAVEVCSHATGEPLVYYTEDGRMFIYW